MPSQHDQHLIDLLYDTDGHFLFIKMFKQNEAGVIICTVE